MARRKLVSEIKRLLGLHAAARVAPGAQQHPHRQRAQGADQPEEAAAHHAQRGAVTLGAYQQAVADRRDRYLVLGGAVGPGQQPRRGVARRRQVARQHLVFVVDQRDRVLGRDLGRHAKAQQPVDGVFAHDHAGEFALVVQRHLQLQRGRVVAAGFLGRQRSRIHRLAQVPGQLVSAVGLADLELLARAAQLAGIGAGRHVGHLDAPLAVNPGHRHQFGVLVDQRFGLGDEFLGVDFLVGDVAAYPHELLLPLQQPQSQALLRVFHVALDGLLLAVDFLDAQIAEGGDHGGQE
jgi:hypothetical protein